MKTNTYKWVAVFLCLTYFASAQVDFTLADFIASSITNEEIILEDLAAQLSVPLRPI